MRIDKVETKVYPFDELSDEAKQAAIENMYDINVDYAWYGPTYEDAETIGLVITEFDTRHCGGDWTEDAEDVAKLIIENHGEDCETRKDAEEFMNSVSVAGSVFEDEDDYDPDYEEFTESDGYEELCEEFLTTICEDYSIILQKAYEYFSTEEAILETIKANEYEFTEDGKLYC